MKFWNKELRDKANKRVATQETAALVGWMDNSIMGLGRAFDMWRLHGGPKEDVSELLTVLGSIWEELSERQTTL